MQTKENVDLFNIWRIRNWKGKRFTFRQHHSTIQRRLNYFFISSSLQESIKTTDAFSTDHSPTTLSVRRLK